MWKFCNRNTINKYKKISTQDSCTDSLSYVSRKRRNLTAHSEFEAIQGDYATIQERRMFLHIGLSET